MTTGMPADDMLVECHRLETTGWVLMSAERTDANGHIHALLQGGALASGDHRINFMTGAWFARRRVDCFFPSVSIEIRITDPTRHHHASLLLSPFAYSVHRGV